MLRVAWFMIIYLFSMVTAWCPKSNPCCMGTNPPSWDAWSYWSDCYPDCGYGTRERSRYCLPASECPDCTAYYDCYCDGLDHQTESCFTPQNPASWGVWGEWTYCSAYCGYGYRHRFRDCEPASYCPDCSSYDCDCPGDDYDEEECFAPQNPASWGYWGAWGDCDPECGYGTKYRYRDCEPDYYCPDCYDYDCECPGSDTEEMECYTPENLPEWGEWSSWKECSEPCGRGLKYRYRECLPPYVCPDDCYYHGSCYCYGDDYELMECEADCTSYFRNEELTELTITASDNSNSALDALSSSGSCWTPGVNAVAYWRAYLPKDSCCRIVFMVFEFRYSTGVLVSEMMYFQDEFTPVKNFPALPNENDEDWKGNVVYFSDYTRKIELEVSPSSLIGPKACIRNVEISMCCV